MQDPDLEDVKEAAARFLAESAKPGGDPLLLVRYLRMTCHMRELQMEDRARILRAETVLAGGAK